ncbi:serine hydrolase [Streptococcus panodentis]|uniref:Methicillin resistance protein FmtA n=1 Tax=Streptococcus panodentis TaxID=1581472 RepID=A0ABS5AV66_9STRE|nr:serine hydrolase domain-containing protein [Streptococcus panodentis]MBP2620148.1 methicillin resistance protein FmtA [Streptococcus panodentis]
MKKSILFIILTVLTLGIFRPVHAQAASQKLPSGTDRSQIGQKIQDYVKEHEKTTAGMETAVFDTNGTIYRGNFGYMDKEKGIKADDSSVFEWGSVTKLTVWVSVMQLWEEGKINLEEDIRTYLPEGFLKNLRYDKPITMLDLMNHQAGFEEASHAGYLENKGQTIEEILAVNQPAQIFEPGTTTAYSNYGAGLASYIVERLSGQNFADYAHEHIFQPLGMDKTSILPGFTDNDYVRDKRKEAQSYDIEGKAIGSAYFHLGLYPVGQAASTMEDFQKFAQALLKKDKLFKRAETWTTLYTATSTYPGTDKLLNAHGFMVEGYGTMVLGHGGNSTGYSSYILLDLKNGIGLTVMTNQKGEDIYNVQMPELIFGAKKKTDKAAFENFQPGYYRSARYFETGPLSLVRSLFYTSYAPKSMDNSLLSQNYAVLSQEGGQEKVTSSTGDTLKIPDAEIQKDQAMYLLAAVGLVYAVINLIISGGIDMIRLLKKTAAKTPKKLRIWNYVTSLAVLAAGLNFALFFLAMTSGDISFLASWRYMIYAGLGLILAACAVYPLVAKAWKELSKSCIALTVLTSLSALAILANILYWSLYQWWVI